MAKTLKDYPVNFPFGATSSPYSASNPHHGDDIAAPTGTPIVVSGVKLGEVGSTGASTGPHCHVDKNRNYPATWGYVQPSGWSIAKGKVVFAGYAGTAGNMVVIKAENAYYYRYLHMSKISVKVGDSIKGGSTTPMPTEKNVRDYFALVGEKPSASQIKGYMKKGWPILARDLIRFAWAKPIDIKTARYLAALAYGYDGQNGRPDAFKGDYDKELKKGLVGQSLNHSRIVTLFRAAKAVAFRASAGGSIASVKSKISVKIDELKAFVKGV